MTTLPITKTLLFRVAFPITAAVLIAAAAVTAAVSLAFVRFDLERHRELMATLSHEVYTICEEHRRGRGGLEQIDETARLRIVKARAMAALEDFVRASGMDGVIADGNGKIALGREPGHDLLAALDWPAVREAGSFRTISSGGKGYYVAIVQYPPWQWRIFLIQHAETPGVLARIVGKYYLAGLLILAGVLAAVLLALRTVIKRPIDDIVRTVRSGGVPQYQGIAEFEYLSTQLGEAIRKRNVLLANIEQTHFLYSHDVHGTFTFVSPSITQILGYGVDEFAAHYTTYLTAHSANALVVERTEQSIRGIQQPPYEAEVYHKDGSKHWLEVTEVPVRDERGTVIAVEGIARDVTERKCTEEDLRAGRELLATLMESLPGMAYRCRSDREWTMEFVSAGCRELTGYLPGDLVGNRVVSFGSLIHPEDRGIVWRIVQETVAGGGPYRLAYRIFNNAGQMKWVWEQGQALAGDPPRRVGFITDITETRRLEEELQKAQKLKALGALAGGIAHDFNNLLQAILGNVTLAKLALNDPEKLRGRLTEAELATRRAGDLSSKLLTFSSGGKPTRKIGSIAALLNEAVQAFRSDRSVTVDLTLAADLLPVEIDGAQIRQVLQNVLQNAREAMPGGGTVRIAASNANIQDDDGLPLRSGMYVKVVIADTGRGIPRDHLARVFDPYHTTKDIGADKGSGLGLTVCHSIITKHDGIITVDSAEGSGTVVTICLPAAAAGGKNGG